MGGHDGPQLPRPGAEARTVLLAAYAYLALMLLPRWLRPALLRSASGCITAACCGLRRHTVAR